MRATLLAIGLAAVMLAGCNAANVSFRPNEPSGLLPPGTVADFYKAGVADRVNALQMGQSNVQELRISKPQNTLIPGQSYVEVAAKIPASIAIGDIPTKCYKVTFLGQVAATIARADLDGCTGGMEDMLAFYKAKYPQ